MARGSEVDALKMNERMEEEVYDDADLGPRRGEDSIEPMLARQRSSKAGKSPSMKGTGDQKKVALALEVRQSNTLGDDDRPTSTGRKRN